jgi:hypothetical protein
MFNLLWGGKSFKRYTLDPYSSSKLDPNPHSLISLDPDSHKIDADLNIDPNSSDLPLPVAAMNDILYTERAPPP